VKGFFTSEAINILKRFQKYFINFCFDDDGYHKLMLDVGKVIFNDYDVPIEANSHSMISNFKQ
jgi:hypothetical protein